MAKDILAENGGPAFPGQHVSSEWSDRKEQYVERLSFFRGMTLRDYFAAQALPVIMQASDIEEVPDWNVWAIDVASTSYAVADAMLKERAK